ncbi:Uncharacterised protein [Legionella steigerwaltii]|uniref:Uncharacterized protein n=1 Tax=Legionella steigerwaltii TaxID=460 RepID=A0A378LD76_9GAMM|nr:hypothetical protein [Legionella steigerwaltii]KTD79498.1 hypothetical protein Lstg_0714 [Legionella steigerwaltii]STY24617.1 Uncharacterised protein [Legionella steigerwaltii]
MESKTESAKPMNLSSLTLTELQAIHLNYGNNRLFKAKLETDISGQASSISQTTAISILQFLKKI